MMIRILKFGKRAILKGPRTKEEQFFHSFRGINDPFRNDLIKYKRL